MKNDFLSNGMVICLLPTKSHKAMATFFGGRLPLDDENDDDDDNDDDD